MAEKGIEDLQDRIDEISKALDGIDTAKKLLASECKRIEQELQQRVDDVSEDVAQLNAQLNRGDRGEDLGDNRQATLKRPRSSGSLGSDGLSPKQAKVIGSDPTSNLLAKLSPPPLGDALYFPG